MPHDQSKIPWEGDPKGFKPKSSCRKNVDSILPEFNILDHLESLEIVKELPNEYHCRCPVCDDGGLKINKRTRKFNAFKCGCSVASIREAIRPLVQALADQGWQKPVRLKQTRQWVYCDLAGNPTLTVKRVDDGQGNRQISRYPAGVDVATLSPYRWPQAKEALSRGELVFMVEGEPCVDGLVQLGLNAISFCGGSNSLHYQACIDLLKPYAEQLVICPDRDQAGEKYAQAIAEAVGIARWLYAFPDSFQWQRALPQKDGADIADWIEDGATVEQIMGAVESQRQLMHQRFSPSSMALLEEKSNRPTFEEIKACLRAWLELEDPSEQWRVLHDLSRRSGYLTRDLKDLASTLLMEPPTNDWVLSATEFAQLDTGCDEFLMEGFLPANVVTLLGSPGGLGKTLLMNDWVYALATGTEWGGYQVPRKFNVLFIQSDESQSNTQERWDTRGLSELDNVFIIRQFHPSHMNKLQRVIKERQIDVVVLDSLTSVQINSGVSYKDPEYGKLIYDFKNLAADLRVTPIIIVHTNKSERADDLEKIAGSYAIGAAASEAFILTKPKNGNKDLRILNRVKSRKFPLDGNLLLLNPEDYSFENQGICDKDGNLSGETSQVPIGEQSNREKIRAFLIHNPGIKYHHLEISGLLNVSCHTVRRELNDMTRRHILKKGKAQHGDWAGKLVYWIPLPQIESPPVLEQGNILRLINLSVESPADYQAQLKTLTPEQRLSLYQQSPDLSRVVP